jgi:uncharacterized membrane protein YdjX (TVP38/TMEM64 family)
MIMRQALVGQGLQGASASGWAASDSASCRRGINGCKYLLLSGSPSPFAQGFRQGMCAGIHAGTHKCKNGLPPATQKHKDKPTRIRRESSQNLAPDRSHAGHRCLFPFDLGRFLSLDYLKQSQAAFADLYASHPWQVAGAYFAIYVAATALSLPGAAIITLAGGAIFGLLWGTVIVSFASTIGATLAFLVSRFILRSTVEARFGKRLAEINRGVEKDGAFYLFTLRLIPVVPFFVINLLMGLTRMKALTFYWVSQVGMLAGTLVYVNAGTQLARLDSLQGILSPALLGSFVLLGIFP